MGAQPNSTVDQSNSFEKNVSQSPSLLSGSLFGTIAQAIAQRGQDPKPFHLDPLSGALAGKAVLRVETAQNGKVAFSPRLLLSTWESRPEAVTGLDLSDVQGNSFQFLRGISRCELVYLCGTNLKQGDLSALEDWDKLQVLHVDRTSITSLAPVAGLPIRILTADETKITSLEPYSQNPAPASLFIAKTLVSDLSPLAGSETLEVLDISGSQVTSVEALMDCSRLRMLFVHKDQIPPEVIDRLRTSHPKLQIIEEALAKEAKE
ncbi:MAG: hypothetical protein KDD64_15030 [Bdellovibrionales bacterium]|nr:hypothetical protein [Bdellovibrionales bacterium]